MSDLNETASNTHAYYLLRCWETWWDTKDTAPHTPIHQCKKDYNHEGRHTCSEPGCRSWRENTRR